MSCRSTDVSTLLESLLKAQAEFPPIERLCTGQAGTRKYKYADLADIMHAIRQPLANHGLAILHQITKHDGEVTELETTLYHVSDQWLSTAIPIDMSQPSQAIGSQITYMRRYGLTSLLGIVTETDLDGEPNAKPATNKAKPPALPAALLPRQVAELNTAVTGHAERLCEFDTVDSPEQKAMLAEVGACLKLAAVHRLGIKGKPSTTDVEPLIDLFRRAQLVVPVPMDLASGYSPQIVFQQDDGTVVE